MDLRNLAENCGEWLKGSGPESDIVISSRIRLARNLAEYPFVRRATQEERTQLTNSVKNKVNAIENWKNTSFLDVQDCEEVDRQFLVERQLMSRELAEAEGDRGVVIDLDERFSIMVNEEDHLRIQVMCSGLDLDAAWKRIDELDNDLEEKFNFRVSRLAWIFDRLSNKCRDGIASQRHVAPSRVSNYS